MIKSRIYLVLIFVICSFSNLFSQPNKTFIESVELPTEKESIHSFKNLKFSADQLIRFNFKVKSNTQNTDYHVLLDGLKVKTKYDFVEFIDLKPGIHKLQVVAENGKGKYKSASINFEITEVASSINILPFLIIGTLLLIIVVLFYILKKKTVHNKKLSITVKQDEVDQLKDSYSVLKNRFYKLESEKKNLQHDINSLKRSINELEEANVKLLEQKENLISKQRELEELNKKKDELYATAIHDIKNPASAIKGLVELLNSYELTATEQNEIMQSLVRSSENILRLSQQVSESISRNNYSNEINTGKNNLKEIIDSVVAINNAYAHRKEIVMHNTTSASTPKFSFDAEKIEQAIDNLLNNAIKYSGKDKNIYIKSYFNDTYVTFEVEDQGPGLSEKDQKQAFKKGKKLTPEPTGDEKRSGLGLWIVKNIIESHNGEVFLKSRVGYGSTFGFKLPLNSKD